METTPPEARVYCVCVVLGIGLEFRVLRVGDGSKYALAVSIPYEHEKKGHHTLHALEARFMTSCETRTRSVVEGEGGVGSNCGSD